MNGPAMVAEHLDDRIDAVIASWRSTQRRSGDVPRSDSLTLSDFVDNIPSLIERMADRLRGESSDVAGEAEKHGRMRLEQGYDVAEVVAELGHLRTALIQATFAYARDNDFDLDELEASHSAINHVLNEAAAESVRQFQDYSHDQARSALIGFEARGRDVEVERARLGAVLDSLPVGAWVADADGRIVGLNREAERLQAFPADRTVNQINIRVATPVFDLARHDGTAYRPDEIPLARALRGEVVHDEEIHWLQAGNSRHILVSANPLRGPGDEIAGAVVVAQDIGEQKRLESELRRITSQLTGIIEQSPVMIWRTGPDGRNDFANRTFLDYFGIGIEEATSDAWADRVHPDDLAGLGERFLAALAAREVFAHDFRVRRRDDQFRWFASRAVPLHDDRGEFLGYIGTAADVDDQHELESALNRQREIAEQSSQHKTRLMAALSHDARTPLNAVVLSAQLLEMHIDGAANTEVEECLRTIRNGVKNVLDLLGDLLDLTRIDAGAMPVEPSTFPIEAAMSECLSSVETAARLKGLDCRFDPAGLIGLTVATDRAKFKQIIANFLSNALRYTEKGRVKMFGKRTAEFLNISVEDSGVGIAPVDQARVFDEFATLEGPRRSKDGSTGLGLAICRRLAVLLGGEILIDSAIGRGSKFTLLLPSSIVIATDAVAAPPSSALAASPAGPILVAEDHPDSRRTLGRVLRRMGYRVIEAADGREAVDLARSESPLAILMDVNMPEMDGIDATLAIRSDPCLRGLPIFALTGDVSPENQRRIGEAGVQGYLEKPVTTEALRRALDSLARPA